MVCWASNRRFYGDHAVTLNPKPGSESLGGNSSFIYQPRRSIWPLLCESCRRLCSRSALTTYATDSASGATASATDYLKWVPVACGSKVLRHELNCELRMEWAQRIMVIKDHVVVCCPDLASVVGLRVRSASFVAESDPFDH